MIHRVSDIISDVRIAMDRNMQGDALSELGDVDTLAFDEIVRSKLAQAATQIHSDAPAHLLDGGYNLLDGDVEYDAIYWDDDGNEAAGSFGHLILPEDFLRLVVFKMSDWKRAVFHAIGEDSEEYLLQKGPFAGLRGTPEKPVCAIVVRPEGRALEFFSCRDRQATISKAVYLPYPRIETQAGIEGIDICRRCYTAVVYTAAALVSTAYGDANRQAMFVELAKQSLL